MKIDVFDYPALLFDAPSRGTPPPTANIRVKIILPEASHWATSSSLRSRYTFIQIFSGVRKTHVFWNRVYNGTSRSSKVIDFGTNRKRVCDFLLVINSYLGPKGLTENGGTKFQSQQVAGTNNVLESYHAALRCRIQVRHSATAMYYTVTSRCFSLANVCVRG